MKTSFISKQAALILFLAFTSQATWCAAGPDARINTKDFQLFVDTLKVKLQAGKAASAVSNALGAFGSFLAQKKSEPKVNALDIQMQKAAYLKRFFALENKKQRDDAVQKAERTELVASILTEFNAQPKEHQTLDTFTDISHQKNAESFDLAGITPEELSGRVIEKNSDSYTISDEKYFDTTTQVLLAFYEYKKQTKQNI